MPSLPFARCVRSAIVVAMAAVALAQEVQPPAKAPASRRRPEWKPTLSLPADLWHDVTATTIGATDDWSNKVELADLDGDGRVDVLFANGGDYEAPGAHVPSRVFRNVASGPWPEITQQVFGDATFFARVVKVRDVDGDGRADVFVGCTFGTQSRLFLGAADGRWTDATARLPQQPLSIGDAEFGDVDGDGDLDLLLADWGPGSPMQNAGARPRLWRNDGKGGFVDVADALPDWAVRFCWELELLDVDGDFDLDLLASSKRSPGSFLAHNDGSGKFTDASARLPQFTNNYEFEPMDVDGDGVLDVVTINDGVAPRRFCEHLFLGDGKGGFRDATEANWPAADNPQFDDNMVAFLDFDSDGDADFLIGSLDGPDRLLVNDGKGRFQAGAPVFAGDPTNGTLGIALADLDRDQRLDVVHAQGEVKGALADKVFFGKAIARDTAPPFVGVLHVQSGAAGGPAVVSVRVHDRKSPCMPFDWQKVVLRVTRDGSASEVPLQWYGEFLWRAPVSAVAGVTVQVVATDAAGNTTTTVPQTLAAR
ncbi:MAG: VCBS repeat-containing protein [Planctomycetes bacterium]|nr:VCBS repeat-containing protein [Planctomycetota bacterium]